MVAAWLSWAGRADAVWLVPTYRHPFAKELRSFEHRVAACEALAGLVGPWVSVSTIEAELPMPSFTIVTLDALAARFPHHRFRLVVGADNLAVKSQWRDWGRIEAEYAPIVVGRGAAAGTSAPSFPDISSTEVRRRLAAGEPVDEWVPASVLREWLGSAG
ncbi:MAG: nicotinate-nicotinamide nucleotide adenylyltransferase [Myxococcales bacterium]|nr:nicotinate-nicotinamide nucleotide adenylyltransferase [Myxococcales bacterium]